MLTATGLGGNPRSKFFLPPKAVPHLLDYTKNARVSPSNTPDFKNHHTAQTCQTLLPKIASPVVEPSEEFSSHLLQFNWFDHRWPGCIRYSTFSGKVLVLPFFCWKFLTKHTWKQEYKIEIITGCRYSKLCHNTHYPYSVCWQLC